MSRDSHDSALVPVWKLRLAVFACARQMPVDYQGIIKGLTKPSSFILKVLKALDNGHAFISRPVDAVCRNIVSDVPDLATRGLSRYT